MYERILVGIDGSRVSRGALDEAIGLARDQGAQLRIIHVAPYGGGFPVGTLGSERFVPVPAGSAGEALLREAEARAAAQGVTVETALLEERDRIGPTVIADAVRWTADLIVLGTHGRRGLRHLLAGSIAESVVRSSPIAVLLVHLSPVPRPPRGGRRVRATVPLARLQPEPARITSL
jgi:nucleotide-binding universal stress UspA family protein